MAEFMTNFTAADMLGNKPVASKVAPVAPKVVPEAPKAKVLKVGEPVVEELKVEFEEEVLVLVEEKVTPPVKKNYSAKD
jgi:hypothetical protein